MLIKAISSRYARYWNALSKRTMATLDSYAPRLPSRALLPSKLSLVESVGPTIESSRFEIQR